MRPESALLDAALSNLPGFHLTAQPDALTGGNLNHVWRLSGEDRTVILKHAPPFIAAAPGIPLASGRLAFEARALALFRPGGAMHGLATHDVRPPQLIHFDPELHFVLMEDVGPGPDLAEAVESGHLGSEAGRRLGSFVAHLHRRSLRDEKLQPAFDNRAIQLSRLNVQYLAAGNYAKEPGADAVGRIHENAAALGNLLLEPGCCLVMGDLWPPSVRVNGNALRLIDWEFAHFGRPLQDLAHFGAHCWMQSQTAPTRGAGRTGLELWSAFITGYKSVAASTLHQLVNRNEERLMNVHAGAEILMRSVGPFTRGYVYDGLRPESPIVREALAQGVRLLSEPKAGFFLGF